MNTPRLFGWLSVFAVFLSLGLSRGEAGIAEGELPPTISSALVKVEVFVQASNGEEPQAAGWNQRCPKCGNYHDNALDNALVDDRPVVVAGFLVAADRVLVSDPLIQARFVRRWQVRIGDEVLAARPAAWALDRPALLLALDHAPASARPLAFSSQAKEPLFTVHHGDQGNGWSTWVQPYQAAGWLLQDGLRQRAVTAGSLFVDASGTPVAITMADRIPPGDAWRAVYTGWPWIEHDAYEAMLEKNRETAKALFLRAELKLRALPVRPGEEHNRWNRDESEKKLDAPQTAVVISPRRVLVLASLTPSQTARLESARLRLADGSAINATFVGSSEEYGALVVDPGRDLPTPAALTATPWETLRDRLLWASDVRVSGEECVVHCGHLRLASLKPGYKNRLVPSFGRGVETSFLFDSDGRLVGLPMARRVKAKQNSWESSNAFIVAAGDVARFNGETAVWADPRNQPMSEAESRRLAWLGVDLQPLDADLALTHGVAAQTENGSHGALVTHVYADSPAARVGLKMGDVLLRVHPEGAAKPIEIRVERHAFTDQPFPWDRYDEVNEAYYDRIPRPWLPAENALHLQLKDFGIGTPYQLDYARDGRVASIELKVEAGPVHFMTAPESTRDQLGFGVRELTFETRRFYQLADDVQALIIAKVEAGGAAAVAGLKPYELITAINDQPVGTVAAFESAMTSGGVLRLGVRRMHQTRVVALDTTAKTKVAENAEQP